MPAKLVPTVQTKYSQFELDQGLIKGWIKLFGTPPTKSQIGVLWSQNALETGLTAAMWCNNIGNVKYVPNAGDTEAVHYCMLRNVWEIINGKKVYFQPPSPATWFRAFDTLEEGVAFFFDLLRNRRYKAAWTAIEAGDPALFAHLLKVAGYYTASEADYRNAMLRYYNAFMASNDFEKALAAVVMPTDPAPVVIDPVIVPEPLIIPPLNPISLPSSNLSFIETIWQVLKNIFSAFKRN